MKARPIAFTDQMVRAILGGRKTQTRRLLKMSDGTLRGIAGEHAYVDWQGLTEDRACYRFRICNPPDDGHHGYWGQCHLGVPGDRLWVKETFAPFDAGDGAAVAYRATCDEDGGFDYVGGDGSVQRLTVTRWNSPRFMPRWASRLTLEITHVRVERLQMITREDILAEGVWSDGNFWRGGPHPIKGFPKSYPTELQAFADLWDSIHGERGDRAAAWATNPWVLVVGFKRIDADAERAA